VVRRRAHAFLRHLGERRHHRLSESIGRRNEGIRDHRECGPWHRREDGVVRVLDQDAATVAVQQGRADRSVVQAARQDDGHRPEPGRARDAAEHRVDRGAVPVDVGTRAEPHASVDDQQVPVRWRHAARLQRGVVAGVLGRQ
jgi:hypothetical protein